MDYFPSRQRPARSFQDLVVWQRAHELVLEVYRVTGGFPRQETYALTSQLRRAAVSVPANIAEGFRRRSLPDKRRFYNMAEGSLEEVRYYLILSRDLKYADARDALRKLEEVSRLLKAYTRKLLTSDF